MTLLIKAAAESRAGDYSGTAGLLALYYGRLCTDVELVKRALKIVKGNPFTRDRIILILDQLGEPGQRGLRLLKRQAQRADYNPFRY